MDYNNKWVRKVLAIIQRYDHDLYWTMREYVQNYKGGKGKAKALFYLIRIKRMDAFANASTGINYNGESAFFESRPRLPHGLYGIIIAPGAHIGKNVRICQQVTIGNDFKSKDNVPTIGDNVEIYPGAKIVGKVHIGNNVRIGANVVVSVDIPDGATVVLDKPRIILKE